MTILNFDMNGLPLHEQFEDQLREVECLKDKLAVANYSVDFYRKAFLIFSGWLEYKYDPQNPLFYRDQCARTLAAIDGVFAKQPPPVCDFDFDSFNAPIDFLKSFRSFLESRKNLWSQGKPIS